MTDPTGRLTEFQLAEIKKAYAICDQDGNGSVDANELRVVIRALLDEDPTDEEMQAIMVTMDKDQNGRVELQEFVDAMADWFSDDERNQGAPKRRKLNVEQERTEVHAQIRSFFQQFKKGDNYELIRKKISRLTSRLSGTDASAMEVDNTASIFGSDVALTNNAKLEFLKWYRGNFPNVQTVLQAIFSEDRWRQVDAIADLSKMLSIVEVFATPSERRAVSDDIIALFQHLNSDQVIGRVIFLMRDNANATLQLHCLRLLFYYAPGPRIASTPKESPLHPDRGWFKEIIIRNQGMPTLFPLLLHPNPDIRGQAVLVLGTMATHHWALRDDLLRQNVLGSLMQLIQLNAPIQIIRKVAWTISIFCGVTHPMDKLPAWEHTQQALTLLAVLIHFEDELVLVHALNALTIALPGIDVAPDFRARLLELPLKSSGRVVVADLALLQALAEYDQNQAGLLIQAGVLDVCKKLLTQDISIRVACCELLYVLAKRPLFIEAMINCGLVELIMKLITLDEQLRWKLVKVIKYVSRGTPNQVNYLVNNKAITILCRSLSFFKSYDRVLTDVYKYCGATYNFEFVNDILVALEKILEAGELAVASTAHPNKFALEFDLDSIDKFKLLMIAIKESRPEDLNAWRQKKVGEANSLEARVANVLRRVKITYDNPLTTAPAKAHASHMIAEIWTNYLAPQSAQQAQPQPVTVADAAAIVIPAPVPVSAQPNYTIKCCFGEDIRVLEIAKTQPWDQMRAAILGKFEIGHDRHVNITYLDEDGDHVTIDSISLLEKAAHAAGARAMKLFLKEIHSFASPFGSPKAPRSPVHRHASEQDEAAASRKRTRDGEIKKSTEGGEKHVINTQLIVPTAAALFQNNTGPHNLSADLISIRREAQKQVFEDLEFRTHFGKAELEQLFESWAQNASADGQVNREQFGAGMVALGITDPLLIEQNFSAFDQNRDGLIDFREFVCGLSTILRGDGEERLRFMFRSYDVQNRGYLTRDEIHNLFVVSMVTLKGDRVSEEEIRRQVESTFAEIDTDGDGKLTWEEFKRAVETQQLKINCDVRISGQ